MKKEEMGGEEIYLAPERSNPEEAAHVSMGETKTAQNEGTPVLMQGKPKANIQISEMLALRERNRKVYRMGDGSEQAVFYPEAVHVFNKETKTFENVDNTLIEKEDGRHFVSGRNH